MSDNNNKNYYRNKKLECPVCQQSSTISVIIAYNEAIGNIAMKEYRDTYKNYLKNNRVACPKCRSYIRIKKAIVRIES